MREDYIRFPPSLSFHPTVYVYFISVPFDFIQWEVTTY
jgi:hypothetical protein